LPFNLAGSEHDPGNLSQQVGAVAGDFTEFRHPGGLPGLVRGAPLGVPGGDTVQPGNEQAVSSRSGTIMSHPARIEHP